MNLKALVFPILLIIIFSNNFVLQYTNGEILDFFIESELFNITLEEWAKKYWQWWATVNFEDIPKDPHTNKDICILGQDPTGVIFLFNVYDKIYSTQCTINSENFILVPLLIGECDATVETTFAKTGKIEDLQKCAMFANEIFRAWEVKLDGKILFKKSGNEEVNPELKDKILVRNSSPFTLNIPINNSWGVTGGNYTATVDGWYLLLNKLPIGEHTLEYTIVHEVLSGTKSKSIFIIGEGTYYFIVK